MAFTRRKVRDPWAWSRFDSPEAMAWALCEARIDTDEARTLLRTALREAAAERERLREEYEAQRKAAESAQMRRDALSLAAGRLLRDCGHITDSEDPW